MADTEKPGAAEALDGFSARVDALGTISEQILRGISNMNAQVKALRTDVDGLITNGLVKNERIQVLESRVGLQERQVGAVLNKLRDMGSLLARIEAKL
jgi:hypothetical protein